MGATPSGWAQIRESATATPELRARYESTRRAVTETRCLLQELDAMRERAGLSKAALAHLIGMEPSAVRRLFTSSQSNPNLQTVFAVMAALGVRMQLKVPRHPREAAAHGGRRQRPKREDARAA